MPIIIGTGLSSSPVPILIGIGVPFLSLIPNFTGRAKRGCKT